MSDLGFVILAGRRLKVTKVALEEATVVVTCVKFGPDVLENDWQTYTVFGSDGRGVWQGDFEAGWDLPTSAQSASVRIRVAIVSFDPSDDPTTYEHRVR